MPIYMVFTISLQKVLKSTHFENSLAISYRINHILTIRSSSCTVGSGLFQNCFGYYRSVVSHVHLRKHKFEHKYIGCCHFDCIEYINQFWENGPIYEFLYLKTWHIFLLYKFYLEFNFS